MKITLKNILVLPLLFLSMALASSCNNWLKDVATDDKIMEDELYSTESGYLEAMTGIYTSLLNGSLYGGALTYRDVDIMAQFWKTELNSTTLSHNYVGLGSLEKTYRDAAADNVWNAAYTLINNINSVLEHVEDNGGLLDDDYAQMLRGELLGLRALIHFELYRFYSPAGGATTETGFMPYCDASEFVVRPLLGTADAMKRISEDLKAAEDILLEYDPVVEYGTLNYEVEGTNNEYGFRNLRMNYFAVKAITARVAMFAGDKETALAYAEEVIKETIEDNSFFPFTERWELELSGDPDRIFSNEMIFGAYNSKRSSEVFEGYFFESLNSTQVLTIENSSIDYWFEFTSSDLRRMYQWNENQNNAQNQQMTIFSKYLLNTGYTGDPYNVYKNYYMPIIRISELFLICAECYMESDPTTCCEYLNYVRYYRNVPDVAETADLFTAIQDEYMREFVGEGQLFWFYKRNNVESILALYDVEAFKLITMTNGNYLFEIPENEQEYRIN